MKVVRGEGWRLFFEFALLVVEADTALPFFDGPKKVVALGFGGPDGFPLFQPDFILPFALAIVVAAKMGRRRDPHDAIQRNILIVNSAKDGHGNAVL